MRSRERKHGRSRSDIAVHRPSYRKSQTKRTGASSSMSSAAGRLSIVNGWLGWGDPTGGLWFIGMEEGAVYTKAKVAEVAASVDRSHNPSEGKDRKGQPVATKTAKIVSKLIGFPSVTDYRNKHLWLLRSKVFNGNLLPIGKPHMTSEWPTDYPKLFGFSAKEFAKYYETTLKPERYGRFKEFRKKHKPQAIVCFGKKFWPEFETVFVNNPSDRRSHIEADIKVYAQDRVLLTRHFAYMSNESVELVVRTLTDWGVTLPCP